MLRRLLHINAVVVICQWTFLESRVFGKSEQRSYASNVPCPRRSQARQLKHARRRRGCLMRLMFRLVYTKFDPDDQVRSIEVRWQWRELRAGDRAPCGSIKRLIVRAVIQVHLPGGQLPVCIDGESYASHPARKGWLTRFLWQKLSILLQHHGHYRFYVGTEVHAEGVRKNLYSISLPQSVLCGYSKGAQCHSLPRRARAHIT